MELFPIMMDGRRTEYIPYSLIECHETQAIKNHSQTLKRLAERSGLDYVEALAVLEDRPYKRMKNETAREMVQELIRRQNEVN